MDHRVGIAVIGAGYWGKKVLAEYVQLAKSARNVAVSMVCDQVEGNLGYCNGIFKIPKDKLAKDYKTALASDEVNAVHICTPNETHYSYCKEALKAGKHVLLEKPMALEARHAWELVGLAKACDLCLQVGHIFRFNNALKLMRDLVAQQYLGEIYYLKLQWTTLMDSPLNRDIIFDLGPHPVDIVNYLMKKWPSKVACKARAYRRPALEELAYATMEFDERFIANIELSWLQPGKIREAALIGSERTAVVDCVNQLIRVYGDGDGESYQISVPSNNTILDETENFVKNILGEENHNNPGLIGARNVAVLEKLKESMKKERTVEVEVNSDG